jgi:hypothetical protein
MNVEKLQKINKLALELRKHNFALSSDDAVEQAEQALRVTKEIPKVKHSDTIAIQQEDPALDKLKILLEMSARKNQQEIQLLKSAIKSLAKELEQIKEKPRAAPQTAPFVESPSVTMENKPEAAVVLKEHQSQLKTEPREAHPRHGNYQPGDIDIKKMFYFGNKGK